MNNRQLKTITFLLNAVDVTETLKCSPSDADKQLFAFLDYWYITALNRNPSNIAVDSNGLLFNRLSIINQLNELDPETCEYEALNAWAAQADKIGYPFIGGIKPQIEYNDELVLAILPSLGFSQWATYSMMISREFVRTSSADFTLMEVCDIFNTCLYKLSNNQTIHFNDWEVSTPIASSLIDMWNDSTKLISYINDCAGDTTVKRHMAELFSELTFTRQTRYKSFYDGFEVTQQDFLYDIWTAISATDVMRGTKYLILAAIIAKNSRLLPDFDDMVKFIRSRLDTHTCELDWPLIKTRQRNQINRVVDLFNNIEV